MTTIIVIGLGLIAIGIANGRKPVLQPIKVKSNDHHNRPPESRNQ